MDEEMNLSVWDHLMGMDSKHSSRKVDVICLYINVFTSKQA